MAGPRINIAMEAERREAGIAVSASSGTLHMIFTGNFTTPWGANEKRESTFVFIGKNLPYELLKQKFLECEVPRNGVLRVSLLPWLNRRPIE